MNLKPKDLLVYGILALATTTAVYYFFKSQKLNNRLEESRTRNSTIEAEALGSRNLLRIDSLVLAGNYKQALRAYDEELKSPTALPIGVQLRKQVAARLQSLENKTRQSETTALDSLQLVLESQKTTSSPGDIRQLDSLNFALDKAQIQISRLRKQLGNSAGGKYLQFTNRKGSAVHYVGQVRTGKANGIGIGLFSTGSRYEGSWEDNMRHGEGSFYWQDGQMYTGNYVNDLREGQGTYAWPNGEKYVGQWKADQRNGKGIFYGKKGEVIAEGVWKDDKLVEAKKSGKTKR